MALKALGGLAKADPQTEPGWQAAQPQEMPGFYTNAQGGVDKEALSKQLAAQLREIFPDQKYWAASRQSHKVKVLESNDKEDFIRKLKEFYPGLPASEEAALRELFTGSQSTRMMPLDIGEKTYDAHINVDDSTYSLIGTEYLQTGPSCGQTAVGNLVEELAKRCTAENVSKEAGRLLSAIRTVAQFNPDILIDLASSFASDFITHTDGAVAVYLAGGKGTRMGNQGEFNGDLKDLAAIMGLDPAHANELKTAFITAHQRGGAAKKFRNLYMGTAQAAGNWPDIRAAFMAFRAILGENAQTVGAGYSEEQALQLVPRCGKYVGAALMVLSNAELPKKAHGGAGVLAEVKDIINFYKINDDIRCKIFHALIPDKLKADLLIQPILGKSDKEYGAWKAKISGNEERALADFIDRCNLEITPEKYQERIKKY
ncbi:MAG: hypothetical protein NTX79_01035 [Candidatus Micrarchaeota archaeon]|nr:hypothetical protein [Candidatus Micrarchaeota archaeon]